jgi:hypothetical protein
LREKLVWKALVGLSAVAAAWAAREATTAVWSRISNSDDPSNPADADSSWGEALAWAAVAGVIAATARVVARRGATEAWEAFTGEAPPCV